MDKTTEYARKLRKEMTRQERHLWYDFLRGYPIRFMRQHPINGYIADFYCAKASLVIELDGSQHFEEAGMAYDAVRDERIAVSGNDVLRIANNEVDENFDGVCRYIDSVVRKRCGLPAIKSEPSVNASADSSLSQRAPYMDAPDGAI